MHIRLSPASPIRLSRGAPSAEMATNTIRGEHWHSLLATNLRALKDQQFGGSVNALASKLKVNQSTLNRYCNGSGDITMQKISYIAEMAGYAPWQLLHPDFDTRRMPPMMDSRAMRVAAIFANIPDPKDRDRAEAIMEQFSPD